MTEEHEIVDNYKLVSVPPIEAIRNYLTNVLKTAKGDHLEWAESTFRNFTAEQLNGEHVHPDWLARSFTPTQTLTLLREERALWHATVQLLLEKHLINDEKF